MDLLETETEIDTSFRACLRRLILHTRQFYENDEDHKTALQNVVLIPQNIVNDVYEDPEGKKRAPKSRLPRRVPKKPKLEEITSNKTPVTLLHEYCGNILKVTPEYKMTIQEDTSKPFVTTITVKGKEYAPGEFGNKKTSKQIAAYNALRELAPHIHCNFVANPDPPKNDKFNSSTFLIDDPNVLNLQNVKTPIQIIQEYCTKFHKHITFQSEPLQDNHSFKVVAKIDNLIEEGIKPTKKEAKQLACQKLIQKLHPTIKTWDAVIDLYSQPSKTEEDRPIGPNLALIKQIKDAMQTYMLQREFDPVFIIQKDKMLQ